MLLTYKKDINYKPNTSFVVYILFSFAWTINLIALIAPVAKHDLLWAWCFNSILSPGPAYRIMWSPTISPARIEWIPISFLAPTKRLLGPLSRPNLVIAFKSASKASLITSPIFNGIKNGSYILIQN